MHTRTATSASRTVRAFGVPEPSSAPQADTRPLNSAIDRARERLASLQRVDGHWCAELEGDTILESEFVLLQAFLGRIGDPRIDKCARYILSQQCPHGGWANFPGGPPCISTTVKAYFALKLAGMGIQDEPMKRARVTILDLGGAEKVNSFTRFYLAALGQIPYGHCPSVPPELILLPRWFPINLYKMSAWTRTIVVPLSIFYAHQPVTSLPNHLGIAELFRVPPSVGQLPEVSRIQGRFFSWENFFRVIDRGLKVYGKIAPRFLRGRAVKAAERWMLDRFEGSDGLGAIYPPMVYTIIALRCLGYSDDSAEMRWAEKQLDDLIIEDRDTIRIQPCVSPIWDTALAMIAMSDAGTPANDPRMLRSADWLLDREVRERGDWAVDNPNAEPGGWAFEYNNQFYPDVDDTAMVLMALRRTGRFDEDRCQQAVRRGLGFLSMLRNSDHGWAAFDKGITNPVLESIPFADHNAMLDPTCPDITARVLEAMGKLGQRRGSAVIDKAIALLWDRQEPEGCWLGRWGVNYLYGTWQTLAGLASVGYDMQHPRVRRAVQWLESVQQPTGAWGESCESYNDRTKMGQGPATPSQTAWALLALLSAGDAHSTACRRGIEYLLSTQNADGNWDEPHFTGTGFPKVFYLRYHYYRLYFPLMALARYLRACQVGNVDVAETRESTNEPVPLDDEMSVYSSAR